MPSGRTLFAALLLPLALTTASLAVAAPAHAAPVAPVVTSAEYPNDEGWHDGVGTYGTFTFTSASPEVVRYRYWSPEVSGDLIPSEPGGPVSFRYAPRTVGVKILEVWSYDAAGVSSPVTKHWYMVAPGRSAVGAWRMADPVGSLQAADAASAHPATAGPGVEFGVPGPKAATAARLDGTSGAHLATGPGVLTRSSFTVSAWVRPASVAADMTALRIAGGPRLGYSAEDSTWEFALDGGPALRGGVVHVGEWAQLTGIYDAEAGIAELYANGLKVATAPWTSAQVPGGAVEFGPGWNGDLAEVVAHDRFIVGDDIAKLAELKPTRVRYWQLNAAADGASPEYTGGPALTLGGDPAIYSPQDDIFDPPALIGSGHLQLDGVDDHATAAMPVPTDRGFTVSLVARPADRNRSMTALSVSGENNSAFRIRYNAQMARWEAVVAKTDEPGAETVVAASLTDLDDNGSSLVLAYDRRNDLVTLYAGSGPAVSVPFHPDWSASGGLQLGRALIDGQWGEYFAGDVDEVRVYEGTVGVALAVDIGIRVENPGV